MPAPTKEVGAVAEGILTGSIINSHAGSVMKKVLQRVAVSGAMTALAASGLVAVTAQPAAACPSGPFYVLTSSTVRIAFKDIPTYTNGPGGKMIVSKGKSGTASFQVTTGSDLEVNAVLASARLKVDATLTKENTTTSTNAYERNITPGRYGNARYDSIGRRVNYTKQQFINSCRQIVTVARGTIKYPSQTREGWYYWESAG